nr:MAG TPA: hypothetical protein [Caudoviricetes sp.]
MKLQEILDICDQFTKHPEDETAVKAYNDMLQNLVIRAYLPMQEKVVALVRMVMDSDKDIDVPETFFTAGLEIACCFDGLLSYVNIEPEVNPDIKSYENYDLIYQSGLADYILEYCGKDYERLVRMMERTLSYENLTDLVQSMREMDTGSLRELVNTLRNMKDEIDPEVIKNIADIARMNDPALNDLKDTIDNEAVDKAFEEKTDEKPN